MYSFALSDDNFQVAALFKKLGYRHETNPNVRPDFFVFPGGADVTPSLYFQHKESKTFNNIERDFRELTILNTARLLEIPCVGICRGIQFLHVSLGGTLTQHIDGHAGAIHTLLDEEGSPINGWEDIKVNSTHHQCIPLDETELYDEVYTSPELTVEGFVDLERFTMGVQYHPEYPNCPEEGVEFFAEMMKHKLEGIL
jgi:putative glutamine amidotransferase